MERPRLESSSRPGGLGRGLGVASALSALTLVAALTAKKPPSAPPPPPPGATLPERPRCNVAPAAAGTRAHALEREAEAQRARYPFAPQMGLAVWKSWSEAADCLRLAGDDAAAVRTEGLATSWQHRLERDLRASHLRLERALATSEPASAARHARQLLGLLPATSDSYRRWLLQICEALPEAAP